LLSEFYETGIFSTDLQKILKCKISQKFVQLEPSHFTRTLLKTSGSWTICRDTSVLWLHPATEEINTKQTEVFLYIFSHNESVEGIRSFLFVGTSHGYCGHSPPIQQAL